VSKEDTFSVQPKHSKVARSYINFYNNLRGKKLQIWTISTGLQPGFALKKAI
jgi:hypothetical protein